MNYLEIGKLYKADPAKAAKDIAKLFEEGQIKADDFRSVQKIFEAVTPDGREALQLLNPDNAGSFNITEDVSAVDMRNFTNIWGQVYYNKIMEQSKSPALVLTNLIPTVQTDLESEKIAGIAGLGDKNAVVRPGEEFPYVGLTEDYIETPKIVKTGAAVAVTAEAVFYDKTGDLLNQAGRVGEYLAFNKEKRLADMLADINTTYHRYKWKGTSYATYQGSSPWVNSKSSNPLTDYANVDAAMQLLANMVDPNTGEPMLVLADTIVVCPEKETAGLRILNATETRFGDGASNTIAALGPNPISGKYNLVSSIFLKARQTAAGGLGTTWYMGDFKKAFAYMQNKPIRVRRSADNSHNDFHRDILVEFRADEWGTPAVLEPRAVIKNLA